MATKKKVTELQTVETLDNADVLHIVDVSDHSQNPAGSSRKTTIGDIVSKIDNVIVNSFNTLLNAKVDKVDGKGLSTEDYTSTEKNKLATIESGAQANVKPDWNGTGDSEILNKPNIPDSLSDLTKDINFDERYYTETEIDTKITTINGNISSLHDSITDIEADINSKLVDIFGIEIAGTNITAGGTYKGSRYIPFRSEIIGWNIQANLDGSDNKIISFDILVNGTSITDGNYPQLTGTPHNSSNDVSTWVTDTLSAGDRVDFILMDIGGSITRANLSIIIKK